MYDDTFNPLGIQRGGGVGEVHILPMNELFLQLRNRPSEQSFFNISKSKPHTPLASAYAPTTHFEL